MVGALPPGAGLPIWPVNVVTGKGRGISGLLNCLPFSIINFFEKFSSRHNYAFILLSGVELGLCCTPLDIPEWAGFFQFLVFFFGRVAFA